jgi:hypothetical protein
MRYLSVLIAAALFGQDRPAPKSESPARPAAAKKTASKAPVSPALPEGIPKGAVEIRPGLFQHKDAKGEVWHYSRTPFGVQKFKPAPAKEPPPGEAETLAAFDDGDTVRFERKTPFGVAKYSKNKKDLSDAERAALRRAVSGRTPPVAAKSAR